jgi:hypothetical protein
MRERELTGWWRQLHREMDSLHQSEHLEGKDRLGDDGCKDGIKIELKGRGLWGTDCIQCSSGCV